MNGVAGSAERPSGPETSDDTARPFRAYAADFERTFRDDDWSRLEQYFTTDAVYSTPTNGLRAEGRPAVLATLRAAISGFDRRFGACGIPGRSHRATRGGNRRGDVVAAHAIRRDLSHA
jgi:hypothetical protein